MDHGFIIFFGEYTNSRGSATVNRLHRHHRHRQTISSGVSVLSLYTRNKKKIKKKQKRGTSSTSASVGNIYNYIVFVNSTATVNSDWESASLSSSAIDSESGSSDFALYFKAESRGFQM